MAELKQLCGWQPNPDGIKQYARENGNLGAVASGLIGGEQRDCYVYQGLLKCKPTWRRGSQGIGDCVSWGAELAATMLMGVESIAGKMQWIEEAATEPIYGGCRVEALGKRAGGFDDGAFGYAAAEWLRKFGVVLRVDNSERTKNPEHDLRKYSKDKAKQWGNYGCGGAKDDGKLDAEARLHPIKYVTQVKTVQEAIAALQNAYPITIASMAGFGQMRRDANGLCYWVDQWAHQMMLGAIRWRNGKPEFRVFQSWGDCVSGPDPGIADTLPAKLGAMGGDGAMLAMPGGVEDEVAFRKRLILPDEHFPYATQAADGWNPISATSWWIDEQTLSRILSSGDCWTFSGVHGFTPRKLDALGAIESWISDLV